MAHRDPPRHVEHAEEQGDAFHDARPNLVVEGVPVVDVPALHGFDPEPDLLRGRTLDPLTVVRDRVLLKVRERGLLRARGSGSTPGAAETRRLEAE